MEKTEEGKRKKPKSKNGQAKSSKKSNSNNAKQSERGSAAQGKEVQNSIMKAKEEESEDLPRANTNPKEVLSASHLLADNDQARTEFQNQQKRSSFQGKRDATPDGEADEEDNSFELELDTEHPKKGGATSDSSSNSQASEPQNQQTLNILKFDGGGKGNAVVSRIPIKAELQALQPESELSLRKQVESEKPEMISRDISPMSPARRQHADSTQIEPTDQLLGNDQQKSTTTGRKHEFQGITLKQTINISTSGHQVEKVMEQQSPLKISELLDEHDTEYRGAIPMANPILPKTTINEVKEPPTCPLKDIQFLQLERFKRFKNQAQKMGDGFDQIGKKNMMRENREKRKKYDEQKKEHAMKKGIDEEDEAKMDEFTHIIQNVVYARDPKIFDTKNGYVNQKQAFMHENMLDIKHLIRLNEERSGHERTFILPRSNSIPKKNLRQQPKHAASFQELEAKAKYKLKVLENGEVDRSDKTLLFESKFESGNLYLAQKVSDHEYNLLMQNDINTSGHTQWFFFQVKNTRKNMSVQFNLMNFTKPDSLFNYGMRVTVYSQKRADSEQNVGWHKACDRISYYSNGIKKDLTYTSKGYYTLSFSYKFLHDDDVVYFAYSYPYTYSDLSHDLHEIEQDPERRKIFQRKVLCKTLAGNDCEMLTVTEKDNYEVMREKKAIVISSRVHPGEVVGSWMMRGVLFFLTDPDNHEAKMLREKFIFKIIPMLNPDGVINGNYRCSLAGCDLNRRWKTPHKNIHPTIFYTKKLIRELHNERGVMLYCDLHGHSRKQNVFMYGCNNKQKPEECRVFPLILSKLSSYFHFGSCRFGVQKSKESTARVTMYKELRTCPNIFTMESTFSGLDIGDMKGQHMMPEHFEQMGTDLCRTLLIYNNIYIPPELESIYGSKDKNSTGDVSSLFANELKSDKKLLAAGDGDSSGGSDSEPSEDNLPVDEVAKVVPIVDKQQKMQLQKIQKKKALEEKEGEKRPPKKKVEESPTRSPIPRQRSPVKKTQEIIHVKPVEEKKDQKKKPEMKDACTQTERSDYSRIKKMLKQKAEEQRRAQEAQRLQKSPGNLVPKDQIRKNLQSQTGQRDGSGYNQLGGPAQLRSSPTKHERQLQDMRDPTKYQFSQDKYSLLQVQSNGQQHASRRGLQNPSHGPLISPSNNISNGLRDQRNQPPIQGGLQPMPGSNTQSPNPNSQGGLGLFYGNIQNNNLQNQQQSQLIYSNPATKAQQPFQMSRLQSGMVSNTMPVGPGQVPPHRQMPQGIPPGMPNQDTQNFLFNSSNRKISGVSPNKQNTMTAGSEAFQFEERKGMDHNRPEFTQQNFNNLRAAGSTMSKAGEQILQQKTTSFKSGKKPSGASNSNQKPDLRFASKQNSHFGAIHLGGNMSFLKDSFSTKGPVKSQFQGTQQQQNLGVNSVPGQASPKKSSGWSSTLQGSSNFTAAANLISQSGNTRGGTGGRGSSGSILPLESQGGNSKMYTMSNTKSEAQNNSMLQLQNSLFQAMANIENSKQQFSAHKEAVQRNTHYNQTAERPKKKEPYEESETRRSSIQRKNQSQIDNSNSRNHNKDMESIQLFKSPMNSRSQAGMIKDEPEGDIGDSAKMNSNKDQYHPSRASSNLQLAANFIDTSDAKKILSSGQLNSADPSIQFSNQQLVGGQILTSGQVNLPSEAKPGERSFFVGNGILQTMPHSVVPPIIKTQNTFKIPKGENSQPTGFVGGGFGANRNHSHQKAKQGSILSNSHKKHSSQVISTTVIPPKSQVAKMNISPQIPHKPIDPGAGQLEFQGGMTSTQFNRNKRMSQLSGASKHFLESNALLQNSVEELNQSKNISQLSGQINIPSQVQSASPSQNASAVPSQNASQGQSKRPQNGHTMANNLNNNRNIYRMRINQKGSSP